MKGINRTKMRYLDELIDEKQFRFHRLAIKDIDNEKVAKICSPTILREECCLFSQNAINGDDYFQCLHERLALAIHNKSSLPVVRFADGEYAFYRCTLGCNGLYKQAESVEAIRKVMPRHIEALRYIADQGFLAPLVYPENSHARPSGFLSFFKKKPDSSGADFLDLLREHQIYLTPQNYIPFYVIYAYLSSREFASAVHARKVCILNSDFNKDSCVHWFLRHGSHPELSFVEIPKEYVATRWDSIKDGILKQIPPQTELCIVGAGVGALLLCQEIASKCSLPVVDAGHVLNMMNDLLDKSNGVRLYTLRKNS